MEATEILAHFEDEVTGLTNDQIRDAIRDLLEALPEAGDKEHKEASDFARWLFDARPTLRPECLEILDVTGVR